MDMKTITVLGRRWFDKPNGNTYHSVRVLVNGEEIDRRAFEYGYGDQYIQTATAMLMDYGALPATFDGSLTRYTRENGIPCYIDVIDVPRKKDLA